mgnify:CR=1 FL=1
MLRLAEMTRSEKLTLSSKKPGKGRKWVQFSEVYPKSRSSGRGITGRSEGNVRPSLTLHFGIKKVFSGSL